MIESLAGIPARTGKSATTALRAAVCVVKFDDFEDFEDLEDFGMVSPSIKVWVLPLW